MSVKFCTITAAGCMVLASLALAQGSVPAQEPPLTNDDVVKLAKLDLGDEIVIAKINQASAVDFKLDTDSLQDESLLWRNGRR